MEKSTNSSYYLYKLKTRFMQFYNYTYIGIDKLSNKAFVIDPSWEPLKILKVLEDHDAKLDKILLTHSHMDHTNLVSKLVKQFNSKVYISEIESTYYNYQSKNLMLVKDLDTIVVGNTKINCLVTPGHTKGSICFLSDENLFTGDTIFIEGCGICNASGGSAKEMYHSILRLKDMISENTRIYPGHSFGESPGKTMEFVSKNNIYFHIDNIEHFIKYRNRPNNKGLFNFK